MKTQNFRKHQNRLKIEAILKAALCGITAGFGNSAIMAAVLWFTGFDFLWFLLPILAVVVGAAAAVVFYFSLFKPSVVDSARRLDRMGLQERMVTMIELRDDDSCLAKLQRADAEAALKSVDKKQIPFKIKRGLIIPAIVAVVLAFALTILCALSAFGIIVGGDEIIDSLTDGPENYVTINYEAEDGGIIDGEEEQIIVVGTDCTTVTAVADDGYMFKEWSDGLKEPTRQDISMTESVTFYAVFIGLSDEDGEEGENGQQGDQPSDQPGDSSGQQGDEEAPGGDGEFNPDANSAGGKRKPNNQVIDGNTYYREVLEYYQELAQEQMNSEDSELSDEELDLIKQYLGVV